MNQIHHSIQSIVWKWLEVWWNWMDQLEFTCSTDGYKSHFCHYSNDCTHTQRCWDWVALQQMLIRHTPALGQGNTVHIFQWHIFFVRWFYLGISCTSVHFFVIFTSLQVSHEMLKKHRQPILIYSCFDLPYSASSCLSNFITMNSTSFTLTWITIETFQPQQASCHIFYFNMSSAPTSHQLQHHPLQLQSHHPLQLAPHFSCPSTPTVHPLQFHSHIISSNSNFIHNFNHHSNRIIHSNFSHIISPNFNHRLQLQLHHPQTWIRHPLQLQSHLLPLINLNRIGHSTYLTL